MKKLNFILIALTAILLIWVVSHLYQSKAKQTQIIGPYPNVKGGGFTLNSNKGKVSLSDFKGKVVLVYFGYTWCPDVCPTNLSLMANALSQLNAKELNNVQGIFISVDPGRDTLEKLETYSQYFHPNIIGLTASNKEISDIAKKFGVSYRIVKQEKSATEYVVDHSSVTYIVGKDNQLVEILPHATDSETILSKIRFYLQK
ncbi:MAG: SCO family protein [Gammaproteobacteria bacterium]|nr:SCO family protein [Gammaproteobacteria bacterium]